MQPRPNNNIWAPGRFEFPEQSWPFEGPAYTHVQQWGYRDKQGHVRDGVVVYTIDLHDPSPVFFTLAEYYDWPQ